MFELTVKLHLMNEKYLVALPPLSSDINVTYCCFSLFSNFGFTLLCILRFLDDCFIDSG